MEDKKRLEAVLQKVEHLRQKLRKRGIAKEIIEATLSDVDYRSVRYQNNEGTQGLYESDMKWLKPLLEERMISFQGLRFQIFPFERQEIERRGFDAMPLDATIYARFPEGLWCLNVHIPNGAPLDNPTLFDDVEQFFKHSFPEYPFQYFIMRSWLVYPGLVALMRPDSNILRFSQNFEVVAVSDDNKIQALERIYGTSDLNMIQTMPKQTSLQQKAFQNLDALGVAFVARKFG